MTGKRPVGRSAFIELGIKTPGSYLSGWFKFIGNSMEWSRRGNTLSSTKF